MTRPPRAVAVAGLVLALGGPTLATACSDAGDVASSPAGTPTSTSTGTSAGTSGSTTDITTTGTFRTWDETFEDTSRPTEAGAQTPAAPDRTLVTTIRLPDGDGPVPLIVFSHGLFGHPRIFSQLLDTWAAAGFAVAAPAFPLTNRDVPAASANWSGLANQPGDVSFVLDQLLAANDDDASPLHGRIDTDRVAAAGLSLGGATTYGVLFNDCCRDERFSAGMVLAGATLPVSGDPLVLDGHVPLLIVHGDADASLPYTGARTTFTEAAPPVWFVTLHGGTHAPPFEDDVTPYDDTVERFTTDFWQATLGGDATAWDRFAADAAVDGLTTLESRPD